MNPRTVLLASLARLAPALRSARPALLALLVLVAQLGAGPAAALECPFPDRDKPAAIESFESDLMRLRLTDCLGDPKADAAPVVQSFNALTNAPTLLGQTDRLLKALDLLVVAAEQREAANVMRPTWTAMTQELRSVRAALARLGDARSGNGWLAELERAIQPKWRQVSAGLGAAGRSIDLAGQRVDLLAPAGCADGQPACPEFLSQIDLVRVANLMNRLRGYAQSPSLAQQFDESELALKQWDAYRGQGHHQYFWEVWVNGRAMGADLCPIDAGTGMKMGFCKVPQSQWIVLHPEAALRWNRTAQRTADLQASLLVELVGRYAWRWDGAQMLDCRGYSLAATYTQTDGEQRWGFGPMLHMGDRSLAVTKAAGGRWSLVVNVALAERYFGRKQQVSDELRNLRKSSLLDLMLGP
jgi:hypothetical protein